MTDILVKMQTVYKRVYENHKTVRSTLNPK